MDEEYREICEQLLVGCDSSDSWIPTETSSRLTPRSAGSLTVDSPTRCVGRAGGLGGGAPHWILAFADEGREAFDERVILVTRDRGREHGAAGAPVAALLAKSLGPDATMIEMVFVAPRARRCGLGRALVAEAQQIFCCATGDPGSVHTLIAAPRDEASAGFFQACGFDPDPETGGVCWHGRRLPPE